MEPALKLDDLMIHSEELPGVVKLTWSGRSNSRDPGKALVPFFSTTLARAAELGAGVEMHFEKLEHFNSSTIAAVIQIVNAAQSAKVRLTMVYDANLKWQALSFDALRRAIHPFAQEESAVQFVAAPK